MKAVLIRNKQDNKYFQEKLNKNGYYFCNGKFKIFDEPYVLYVRDYENSMDWWTSEEKYFSETAIKRKSLSWDFVGAFKEHEKYFNGELINFGQTKISIE